MASQGGRLYDDPHTPQDWADVAQERRSDAMKLHAAQSHVMCLYNLGFTAECYAKALCVARGRVVPRGRDGHDLLAILATAGYSSHVLPPEVRRFLVDRDVSLRYQVVLPVDVKIEDEIRAANRFVNWCEAQLRRRTNGRRRNST